MHDGLKYLISSLVNIPLFRKDGTPGFFIRKRVDFLNNVNLGNYLRTERQYRKNTPRQR